MSTGNDVAHPVARALVLGGGGVAGIAWEVGVLLGLADGGVDVGRADRIVGTSAGSVVGSLLATGVDLAGVYAEHGDVETATASAGPAVTLDLEVLGREMAAAMAGARDAREMRAALGAWALAADTVPESERHAIISRRLPVATWPDRDLRISAVDAESGEVRIFTGGSGVGLVDAVAASCAVPGVWPPATVDGRRYVDGGLASIVHVEVAEPCERLLVVAPLDPPSGGPFPSVGDEVDAWRARHPDGTAAVVLPDADSLAAFGTNVLDPATMPASAAAGRARGKELAAEAARVWA